MTQVIRRLGIVLMLLLTLLSVAVKTAGKPLVTGLASWYGKQHQGKRMANGHLFDRLRFTAAHRHYRFGTLLRVCFMRTGRCADVEVTDRGPQVSSRSLDISEAAAQEIGLTPYGVGRVSIEEIGHVPQR